MRTLKDALTRLIPPSCEVRESHILNAVVNTWLVLPNETAKVWYGKTVTSTAGSEGSLVGIDPVSSRPFLLKDGGRRTIETSRIALHSDPGSPCGGYGSVAALLRLVAVNSSPDEALPLVHWATDLGLLEPSQYTGRFTEHGSLAVFHYHKPVIRTVCGFIPDSPLPWVDDQGEHCESITLL